MNTRIQYTKIIHLLLLVVFFYLFLPATMAHQMTGIDTTHVRKGWHLSIITPSAVAEFPLSTKWALVATSNVNFFQYRYPNAYNRTEGFSLAVFQDVTLGTRYYYNLSKRARQGRNTRANSASYVSIQGGYAFDSYIRGKYVNLYNLPSGPFGYGLWGIQSTSTKNIYLGFELGWGYFSMVEEGYRHHPIAKIRVGISL